MGFWAVIKIIAKYLPEFLGLIKTLHRAGKDGIEEIQIKKLFKGIDEAFKQSDPQVAATALNDLFRK